MSAVSRHLTALTRKSFSAPLQLLQCCGFLEGSLTVFDYGCGKGDDLRRMKELGVVARGWDPHYSPKNRLVRSDIVNLGFVVNVIEVHSERRETIQEAFRLAKKLLVVSTARWSPSGTPLADGVLTSRNTFQRYFTRHELRAYVETVLGEDVILASSVALVFRDSRMEREFQAALSRPSVRRWIGHR